MSQSQKESQSLLEHCQVDEMSLQSQICGHKLTRMCVSPNCQEYSLHCEDRKCRQKYKKHVYCRSIPLQGPFQLLNQHLSSNSRFLSNLIEIEQKYIERIMHQREQLSKKMALGNLQEKYERIISEIFRKRNEKYLKGREADDFFNKLMSLSSAKKGSERFLDDFEAAVNRSFTELQEVRETIIIEYISAFKFDEPRQGVQDILDTNHDDSCIDISQLQLLKGEYTLNMAEGSQILSKHGLKLNSLSFQRQPSLYTILNKISDQIVKIQSKIEIIENKFNQNMQKYHYNRQDSHQEELKVQKKLQVKNKLKTDFPEFYYRKQKIEQIISYGNQKPNAKKELTKLQYQALKSKAQKKKVQSSTIQTKEIQYQVEMIQEKIEKKEIRQIKIPVQIQIIQNFPRIDSSIFKDDPQGVQKQNYLLKQLGYPSQLKLLFRASQHNFMAGAFHKYCDNIPNTVTIIRTEFNRNIAAFTPLKWQGTKQKGGKFIGDYSSSSFLLQLDLKEKMILKKRQKQFAIHDRHDSGPRFGAGTDLYITDKCNQNKCGAFFHSYNYGSKYGQNQQSYTLFSGATKGFKFRVFEYEVFEVIK